MGFQHGPAFCCTTLTYFMVTQSCRCHHEELWKLLSVASVRRVISVGSLLQIKLATFDQYSREFCKPLGHRCCRLPGCTLPDIPFADLKLLSFAIPL